MENHIPPFEIRFYLGHCQCLKFTNLCIETDLQTLTVHIKRDVPAFQMKILNEAHEGQPISAV